MPPISALSLVRNGEVKDPPRNHEDAERAARERFNGILVNVTGAANEVDLSFLAFERRLRGDVVALARTLVVLFLVLAEARVTAGIPARLVRGGRTFRTAPTQTRSLNTMFGVVRYSRLYMRQVVTRSTQKLRGFHPLDAALGLLADRISMNVISFGVRLATKLPFAEARTTLGMFLPTPPSTEVIEQAVLGLGGHTQRWFEECPAPEDDGDVLVVMIDSKGVPTATDEELAKRRGKRGKNRKAPSPRHRGRESRERLTKKPRRKKGDKAKNAKMGTMVVIYTLRQQGSLLLGPINKRYYASFASKRHACTRRSETLPGGALKLGHPFRLS